MTRRKYWVLLSLILLPSALAVGTFALIRSAKPMGHSSTTSAPKQPIDQHARMSNPASVAPDAVLIARGSRIAAEPQDASMDLATLADTYTAPAPTFDSFVSGERPQHASAPNLVPTVSSSYYGGFAGLIGGFSGALPGSRQSDHAQPASNDGYHGVGDAAPDETHGQHSSEGSSSHSESSTPSVDSHENGTAPTPGDSQTEPNAQPQVSVPEPATWSLFAMALVALTLSRRRRAAR